MTDINKLFLEALDKIIHVDVSNCTKGDTDTPCTCDDCKWLETFLGA